MAAKKKLGMGLDLLLGPVDQRGARQNSAPALEKASSIFEKALAEDAKGSIFEAYHLYRQVIDFMEDSSADNPREMCSLVSRALNNAAVILFENGQVEPARQLLQRAVNIYPDNSTARDNLRFLV